VSREPPATRQTVPNFYLIHDLALVISPDGAPKLGLFVRGGRNPEPDRSMVGGYADAGLNWFGPLPGRADDTAGLAVSSTCFGDDFLESAAPDGFATDETTLEFTYRAQLTRWMVLQADVQLLFNPGLNPDSSSRETAAVLGLRVEVSF
jgi:porin